MAVTLTQLAAWMDADENEHLEFKEAKARFDFEKLVQYCVALANERGGHIILGVTDKKPRRVVGTGAFENLERTKAGLIERLSLRIGVEEVQHSDGRALVFSVPSRPIATPITYAALILFGTYKTLGQCLNQAEAVFEYRSKESSVSHQQREEYRQGFFVFHDQLWDTINLRNDKYYFIDGLFARYIPSFNETAVREAVLNAVTHRNYRNMGSVFVRQFPTYIEIVSPGGFPQDITPKNILWNHMPPNRRLAEAFARCGLVERAGQGVNRMFAAAIREAKRVPDYSRSEASQVFLTLHGEVQDSDFLHFLAKIGKELEEEFSNDDLLVLDHVKREQKIPEQVRHRLRPLRDCGAIERVGRKYILSRQFYAFVGQKGVYTRKRGLNRETNKQLLLKHIRDNKKMESKFRELQQVLPGLTRDLVQKLLAELKKEEKI
ncbi:MAG: ATP-binding protein, partial [Candidatus Latescibacteria bacterium]|nr:ATP-binding protein [Candidatus Latescibacterota bacterium]